MNAISVIIDRSVNLTKDPCKFAIPTVFRNNISITINVLKLDSLPNRKRFIGPIAH